MLALTRYFLRTGILLVVAGVGSGLAGGVRLFYFLTASPVAGIPSTRQVLRWVVVPHIFLAIGLGLVIFGIILIGKGIHFHARQSGQSARPPAA